MIHVWAILLLFAAFGIVGRMDYEAALEDQERIITLENAKSMNDIYIPGPGDLMPTFSGHPHDPRTPDNDDDSEVEVINDVRYWLNLAHVSAIEGDMAKARHQMLQAKTLFDDFFGQDQ